MLRILLGRARTGKSARVLEEIRALSDSSQQILLCLLYTSPSPRDAHESRMPSSA